jgi:hypothetical protein
MEALKVIVTGATRYSFRDQDTGKMVEGSKVYFYNNDPVEEENSTGTVPNHVNMPIEMFDTIKKLQKPHLAEASLSVSFSGKKPTVKISGFKFIKPLPLAAAL